MSRTRKTNTANFAVKQPSNPYSTGGGGYHFEHHVQAVYILAMLVDGFSPILEQPIEQLDFQTKHLGYDTDDLLVTSANNAGRLLCQIKHDITISKNREFKEVVHAAWNDFCKSDFRVGKDKILLITGIITKDSTKALRELYIEANSSYHEDGFFQNMESASKKTRSVLDTLISILTPENSNNAPNNRIIWQFCKSFVLLVFDLDYINSVNRMLLLSLVNQYTKDSASLVWARLYEYAGECDQSSYTVRLETIPDDIRAYFDTPKTRSVAFLPVPLFKPNMLWAQLVVIGSWSDTNAHDAEIVGKITDIPYQELKQKLQQFIIDRQPYLSFNNGVWRINNREALLRECKQCYFEDAVQRVFTAAVDVFMQQHCSLEEGNTPPPFIPASGAYRNSDSLRSGLIRGLCMLTNARDQLAPYSENAIAYYAKLFMRDLFADADWRRFASLKDALPSVAEIEPKTYLDLLENHIVRQGHDLCRLFPADGENTLFSQHYQYGILWSLEGLAWDERYLIASVRCLGELAQTLLANQINADIVIQSIRSILLPWYPQTMASVQKQRNAVQILQTELPDIGWLVLKGLLPSRGAIGGSTHKPKYMLQNIPDEVHVPNETVNQLFHDYSNIAVSLADGNIERLEALVEYIEFFKQETRMQFLSSVQKSIQNWQDNERFRLWNKMSDIKYRIMYECKQSGTAETPLFKQFCEAIDAIAPREQLVRYRRLYLSGFDAYMLREDDISDEWNEKEKAKADAIRDIYGKHGLLAVAQFGECVNALQDVGATLGKCLSNENMQEVLQKGCENAVTASFLHSVVRGFAYSNSVTALLSAGLQRHSVAFIADILAQITLSNELLTLVRQLLPKDEPLFWKKLSVHHFYHAEDTIDYQYAADQLLQAGRATAAVNLCGFVQGTLPVTDETIIRMLVAADTGEATEIPDMYAVRSLIKRLQNAAEPNIIPLSEIEIIYLPWLDEHSSVQPRALRYRLGNDSQFFCELLRIIYKERNKPASESKKASANRELAKQLFHIFFRFSVVPGTDWAGVFHEDDYKSWLDAVKVLAREQDRYETAMLTVGNGLSYARTDGNGVLCENIMIQTLNAPDAEDIREGYRIGIANQRGAHIIDPEGKEERALAEKYTRAAELVETRGYSRYAELLRKIANAYLAKAKENAASEKWYADED